MEGNLEDSKAAPEVEDRAHEPSLLYHQWCGPGPSARLAYQDPGEILLGQTGNGLL
jgi:hypothetical protein